MDKNEHTPEPKSLMLVSQKLTTTTVTVDYVTADTIGVTFATLLHNRSHQYGYYLAIWQSADGSIPWNTPPLQVYQIPNNMPTGSASFSRLDVAKFSYVVGLAVGPSLTGSGMQLNGNICAYAFIENQTTYSSFDPVLELLYTEPTSLNAKFVLPVGISPKSNGAYVGFWRGSEFFINDLPASVKQIGINASKASVAIKWISLGKGLTYTIALVVSGYSSPSGPNELYAMAACVTFTIE